MKLLGAGSWRGRQFTTSFSSRRTAITPAFPPTFVCSASTCALTPSVCCFIASLLALNLRVNLAESRSFQASSCQPTVVPRAISARWIFGVEAIRSLGVKDRQFCCKEDCGTTVCTACQSALAIWPISLYFRTALQVICTAFRSAFSAC